MKGKMGYLSPPHAHRNVPAPVNNFDAPPELLVRPYQRTQKLDANFVFELRNYAASATQDGLLPVSGGAK